MNPLSALARIGRSIATQAHLAARSIAERLNPARLSLVPPVDVRAGVAMRELRKAHQRPLTGLEIRAARMASHAMPTRRTGASRYQPDGIPARVTKTLRPVTRRAAIVAL